MILVDTNVLMYATGTEHQFKDDSLRLLNAIATQSVEAAINAEILQEILHRYRAVGRWEEGKAVFDRACALFSPIYPVGEEEVRRARFVMDQYDLGARDAIHVAVAERQGVEAICSYDRAFDRVETVKRVEPGDIE